jgi:hypothetical protein
VSARCHTLREEHRLRVFVNRMLKGPKREEVTGGWMKLYNSASQTWVNYPKLGKSGFSLGNNTPRNIH